MSLLNKKVVFLDLDNTLTDTEGNSCRAMQAMYNELSLFTLLPPFDEFWRVYHTCNEDLWDRYRKGTLSKSELNRLRFIWPLELMGVKNDDLASKINDTFYKHFLPQTGAVPGAYELLEYLVSKYRLAIISNGTKSSQIVKMKVFKFESYFEDVFLSDDVGFPKPDARIYKYALDKMSVNAGDVVMIGDDYDGDIIGAYNVGIDQIWLNSMNMSASSIIPTQTINTLSEIKDKRLL